MKKCYLDANLLIYYSDIDSPFYPRATDLVSQLLINKWQLFISPLVIDEYFHNMIRFSRISRKEAIKNLKVSFGKINRLPGIELINPKTLIKEQAKVLNLMDKYNLRARDAYHLFTMKVNKIKYFATFDSDFDKVFAAGILRKFE